MAAILDCTERTVTRAVQAGKLPHPRPADSLHDAREVIRWLWQRLARKERERKLTHQERFRRAKADLAEIEVARAKAKLVDVDEVARDWSRHVTDARNLMLTLPERLAMLAAQEERATMRTQAQEIIDGALTTLAGEEE